KQFHRCPLSPEPTNYVLELRSSFLLLFEFGYVRTTCHSTLGQAAFSLRPRAISEKDKSGSFCASTANNCSIKRKDARFVSCHSFLTDTRPRPCRHRIRAEVQSTFTPDRAVADAGATRIE